jgi:hypothetical protein
MVEAKKLVNKRSIEVQKKVDELLQKQITESNKTLKELLAHELSKFDGLASRELSLEHISF